MRPQRRLALVLLTMAFGLLTSGGVASAWPPQGDQKTNDGMMARMGESDARITALAAQMNMSTGEAKIAAMAALLNALVERHKMMPAKPEASKPMCMEKSPAPATASPTSPDPPAHDHSAN